MGAVGPRGFKMHRLKSRRREHASSDVRRTWHVRLPTHTHTHLEPEARKGVDALHAASRDLDRFLPPRACSLCTSVLPVPQGQVGRSRNGTRRTRERQEQKVRRWHKRR